MFEKETATPDLTLQNPNIMKNRLYFFGLLFLLSFGAMSQNLIKLRSGKLIKDAVLFSEKQLYITYKKSNSLHDLEKSKIEYIQTDTSIIQFNANGSRIETPRSLQLNNSSQLKADPPELKGSGPSVSSDKLDISTNYSGGKKASIGVGQYFAAKGLGLAGSAAVGLLGLMTGAILESNTSVHDPLIIGGLTGMAIGLTAGKAAGIYLVGRHFYGPGGARGAFVGSFIGAGASAAIIGAIAYNRTDELIGLGVLSLTLPMVGGFIGYYTDLKTTSIKDKQVSLHTNGTNLGMTLRF